MNCAPGPCPRPSRLAFNFFPSVFAECSVHSISFCSVAQLFIASSCSPASRLPPAPLPAAVRRRCLCFDCRASSSDLRDRRTLQRISSALRTQTRLSTATQGHSRLAQYTRWVARSS